MKVLFATLLLGALVFGVSAQSDDGDDDFSPRNVDEARAGLLSSIPSGDQSRCESVVDTAITQDLFNCFAAGALGDDDDDGDDDDSFPSELCESVCFANFYVAATVLYEADCIPSMFPVQNITEQGYFLNLACTTDNGEYCGDVGDVIGNYFDSDGNVTEYQCDLIEAAGGCIGSIFDALENELENFPYDIRTSLADVNLTAVIEGITDACAEYAVDVSGNFADSVELVDIADNAGTFEYDGDDFFGDDDGEGPANLAEALNFLIASLPSEDQSRCRSVVEGAATQELFNCFTSGAFDDDDDGDDDGAFDDDGDDDGSDDDFSATVCTNTCYRAAIAAANTLVDEDCIPRALFPAEYFVAQGNYLNLLCTRGGNRYCGELLPVFGALIYSPVPSMAQCTLISDAGKCAGNFLDVFENRFEELPDDVTENIPSGVNFTAFGESVVSSCQTSYSIDLSASVDGTEAPANLASSGAFTVLASSMALIVAALMALLF